MANWLAAVLMLALAMPAHAQSLPGNDPPPGPRTGMILGQVVDSAGTPVSEAIVQLTMPKYASSPAAPRGRVMADAEGRFFFSDLPAGEYYLQARKDGYAPGEYGQRRAWGQSLRLPLEENQRTDVTLRVWKFAALGGTVVDEAGEPVVGVAVKALIKRVVAGRTQFGNTELVGEFVPSTQTTLPASFVASADPALRSELFFSGVNEVTLLGQARTQQIGDAAILTPNRGLIPPAPAADGRLLAYRTTFYPAATTAAMATPVTLDAGEERSDLSIALRPEPSVRVSGRLVTADGSMPPPTTIRLTSDSLTDVARYRLPSGPDDAGFDTVTGMSDASGRFTLLGVPPGDYILTHGTRFLARATEQGNRAYWISQPVRVGADDIPNLTVELRPALRVEGRIEYRSPTGAKPALSLIHI